MVKIKFLLLGCWPVVNLHLCTERMACVDSADNVFKIVDISLNGTCGIILKYVACI